jgi:hypothetical protein
MDMTSVLEPPTNLGGADYDLAANFCFVVLLDVVQNQTVSSRTQ